MKIVEAITELRAGILEDDRNRLIEGFFLLTGERLADTIGDPLIWETEAPHPVIYRAEQEYEPPIVKFEKPAETEPRPKEDFSMFKKQTDKPRRRTEPVKASGRNRFAPSDFGDVEDEDPGVIDKVQPVARNRERSESYSVECDDCGKTVGITSVEAGKIFAPGSLYNQTREYHCDLLKCTGKCPNKE